MPLKIRGEVMNWITAYSLARLNNWSDNDLSFSENSLIFENNGTVFSWVFINPNRNRPSTSFQCD